MYNMYTSYLEIVVKPFYIKLELIEKSYCLVIFIPQFSELNNRMQNMRLFNRFSSKIHGINDLENEAM